MKKRLLAASVALGMALAGLGLTPALADDGAVAVATPTPTASSPATTAEPTAEPTVTSSPGSTADPVPTVAPMPSPTPTPTATPAPTTQPIPVSTILAPKWKSLGGATGVLGQPIAADFCRWGPGPCRQEFEGGMIFRTDRNLLAVVYRKAGVIGPHWFATGGVNSSLGYPAGDERQLAGGAYQEFHATNQYWNTILTWRAKYGFIPITDKSGFGDAWLAYGGASGIGYPKAKVTCSLRGGGCSQDFDGGLIIWDGQYHGGLMKGAIRAKWQSLSAQNGVLGYPTGDEQCSGKVTTCAQEFSGGYVYWSAKTGAVMVRGGIYDRYRRLDGSYGALGLPLKDEGCKLRDGGCMQNFQNGQIMWSPKTGARAVKGGIAGRYRLAGAQNGALRYPVTEEVCSLPGRGCVQTFQGGDIIWSAKSGAHTLRGAIGQAYKPSYGFMDVREGYPTGEQVCGLPQGGCYQQFQKGRFYWSPKVGHAYLIWGGILNNWLKIGGPGSVYGYPNWYEDCIGGVVYCDQQFQNGRMVWTG